MLSIGAFNALLKTLEEPPSHVVFILATTEVHKLPATILSRCQRFDFRRIDSEKICERIQYIAGVEGLTVTDGAATLIASAADGGMRDALSILDLCASGSKNIDEAVVESVCAMAGNEYLLELSECIKNQDTERAILLLDKLHNSSVDMLRLLSELTSHYRDLMIVKTVKSGKRPIVCSAARLSALEKQAENYSIQEIMYCLSKLQSSFAAMQSGNRRTEMEMAVIRLCNPSLTADTDSLDRRISILESTLNNIVNSKTAVNITETTANKPVKSQITNDDDDIPPPIEEYSPPAPQSSSETPVLEEKETISDLDVTPVGKWNEIVSLLKIESPLIAGVLNDSKAYIKGEFLLIDAPNSQFRSLINSTTGKYKDSIRKAAFKILGATYKLGPYQKKQTNVGDNDPLKSLEAKLKNLEIN